MTGISMRLGASALVFVSVGLLLAACATVSEDKVQKAKGHYQEGIANLETDRQHAFVAFQKAVQLNPNHKESHYSLGHLYALQQKYPQAADEFEHAVRIDPTYSEAHNYLGQVFERQNRWADAIREYRQALGNPLYSTPDLSWFNLGRALAHEGDMEGAVQAFEDATLITPPSVPPAVLALELGRAYSKLGYETKAKETLARVKTLDKGGPYSVEAGRLMERLKP